MSHSIKRYKLMYNVATAGNGAWIPLDVRYETKPSRALAITVVSGDTVTIQAITQDVRGDNKSFLSNLQPADIVTLTSMTASGPYEVSGPWTYIRAVKTGTTGVATVEGFV